MAFLVTKNGNILYSFGFRFHKLEMALKFRRRKTQKKKTKKTKQPKTRVP